ncbi:DUF4442 domain-containing protein [Bacillus sp. CECT 9360]|uniref:DUF4442 domain-containing protein n=1 Tax=Bacillus sp. CECT 9360 TaxID=2845821 RepID=UPI001E368084|nr:DUF4442 domain-containing protein [Bacillus sp. CECT 9360]CAH0344045.1 hypothetical protein BCI9360_00276 [Bacillus sp. CECT 9360]
MSESLYTKIFKLGFNLFPAFRGTGGRITYIASDFSEIRLKLPLNWRTKNYVRTIYGGSMYGAIDPVYMLMLLKTLGTDYIVWDKAASIRFKKPGRTTLFATFTLTADELQTIKRELEEQLKIDRIYTVHLVDKEGNIYATAEKTMHIRKKQRA